MRIFVKKNRQPVEEQAVCFEVLIILTKHQKGASFRRH